VLVVLACFVAFGWGAAILISAGAPLPFATVEQRDYSGTGIEYESEAPGMVIISRLEDIESLKGLVSNDSIVQLSNLDYNQYFVLGAFQGRKMSTAYYIKVTYIGSLGDTVNVYANLHEPKPNEAVGATETSPYHLIKVKKGGSWGKDIAFKLFSGDTLVASINHMIP
jgi:PrcB C-terminal